MAPMRMQPALADLALPTPRWLVDLSTEPHPDAFAAWHLGGSSTTPAPFTLPLPALNAQYESWLGQGRLRAGDLGAARFAADDELMLAELLLAENDFSGIREATHEAYRRLTDYTRNSGYPFVLRIWSFFAAINEGSGDQERYRQFCIGRQQALERGWVDADPAATVIGIPSRTRWLRIVWLAARSPGKMLDNPRQMLPRNYPRDYGPEPPRFSRAGLWEGKRGTVLLISGTASVVGHSSRHPGNLEAQLKETLRNLEEVLRVAIEQSGRSTRFGEGTVLRAYVREETRMPEVAAWLQKHVPGAQFVVLQGDVCRRELLCEIEAVHHF